VMHPTTLGATLFAATPLRGTVPIITETFMAQFIILNQRV
jgi:hypothetical protein